jgi:hypothetical protein
MRSRHGVITPWMFVNRDTSPDASKEMVWFVTCGRIIRRLLRSSFRADLLFNIGSVEKMTQSETSTPMSAMTTY